MQEVNSLCTDSQALLAEYCIVGIPHNTAGRNTRCSVSYAKRSFYRSSNAIFGKVGKHASEEVTLQLVKSKCMPMLLYGLECFALLKSDVKSIYFAVTRFLMKLF